MAERIQPLEWRSKLDDTLLLAWNLWARLGEWRLPAEHRRQLEANEILRDAHRGERCWIIGNGPSLRDHDLTRLRGEFVFTVNRFIHHPDAEVINPSFYVIVDPQFGAGKWGHDFIEQVERRLPNVKMFVSADGQRFLRERNLMTRHECFVIHPNQYFHFGYPFEIDLTRGIPGADNVTKSAMSIAVFMGFKEINLLGIDGNGLLLPENSHFYGHVPGPTDQVELERALVSSSLSMRSWRALPEWLDKRGVKLWSRNPKSVLTALPFRQWESWPVRDGAPVETNLRAVSAKLR